MAHTLLLGFQESPSGSQDYVDLSGVAASTAKYFLNNISFSDVTIDGQGRPVRNVAITLDINGSSVDDALFWLRELDRFPQTTRQFLKPFEGNIPATTDGTWFEGFAAKLTFKPQNATNPVFWDVLYGQVTFPGLGIINQDILNYQISNVVLTLTCMPYARGPRVVLDNLVNSGGLEPPFDIANSTLTNYQDGWVPDLATNWAMSTTYAKYGKQSLINAVTTGTISLTTNDNSSLFYSSADVTVPQISYFVPVTVSGISLTVTMEAYNGTVWATQQTLVNGITTITGGSWITATGTALVANNNSAYQRVRLKITLTPNTKTIYFGGFAIWRNPTGNAAPVEFASTGGRIGLPNFSIYNIKGDVEAPLAVSSSLKGNGSNSVRGITMGGQAYKPTRGDQPLFGLSLQAATGAADTSMFWGKLGATNGGSAAVSYSYTVTGVPSGMNVDRYPRNYRAFLVYASNATDTTDYVSINFNDSSSNYLLTKFFVGLPPTFNTLAVAPVRADYRIYDLGDFQWALPGSNFVNNYATFFSNVTLHYPSATSANHREGVAGVILIPVDNIVNVKFLPDAQIYAQYGHLRFSSEGTTPTVGTCLNPLNTNFSELNTLGVTGNDYSSSVVRYGEWGLLTTDMRFEGFYYITEDATYPGLYTFDASVERHNYLTYSPRYRAVGSL